MEKQTDRPNHLMAQRALEIYVGVCVILVLIILYLAFQRTEGGVLLGETYVRPPAIERTGN